MGESWKKVKFSDFIYMQRIRDDLNIFSPSVAKHVFNEKSNYTAETPSIINIKDELETILKPIEMCVTKSKEKGKGYSTFMLFCVKNLRVYNTVDEYFHDVDDLKKNTFQLKKQYENILQLISVNEKIIEDQFLTNQSEIMTSKTDNVWTDEFQH